MGPLRVWLVLVLGLVDAIGPLSIDLYVPSFLELQHDLALIDLTVQLTLAAMTAGLALGQAVEGTWSDRIGRRRPLLLSCGLYVVSALTCTLAPSIAVLLVGRIAQGVGAAGGAVLVLAIVGDISDGPRFVALLTRVTLITTTAPSSHRSQARSCSRSWAGGDCSRVLQEALAKVEAVKLA